MYLFLWTGVTCDVIIGQVLLWTSGKEMIRQVGAPEMTFCKLLLRNIFIWKGLELTKTLRIFIVSVVVWRKILFPGLQSEQLFHKKSIKEERSFLLKDHKDMSSFWYCVDTEEISFYQRTVIIKDWTPVILLEINSITFIHLLDTRHKLRTYTAWMIYFFHFEDISSVPCTDLTDKHRSECWPELTVDSVFVFDFEYSHDTIGLSCDTGAHISD